MINEKEILEFKNQLATNLNKKFPEFEEIWNEIVKSLGHSFVGLVKENLKDELKLFKEISNFRFSVVIDNNFIFGQIKNAVEKNKNIENSFIYKLVNSSYIDVYAPFKLKEELYDKISTVLKDNNKLAEKYANQLIEKIIIKDAQWIDEWKKANNLIGHIDEDDVPYLALAFHVESHAIISNDKIFKKQGLSKSWNIQETDKIITSYNSGFISFCFIGTSMLIIELIWKTIVSIFKIIEEIFLEIITGIGLLVVGSVDFLLNNVPSWVLLLILAIGIGASVFSEDFKKVGEVILIKIKNIVKKIIVKIKNFLKWVIEIIKEFWEIFKPVGITGLEILGYFILEYELMTLQVAKLENERAK